MAAPLKSRDGVRVLTLEREFAHPVDVVWPWLTEPARLARWSPRVPDLPFDGAVSSVEPPRELVHRRGDDVVRWRLVPTASGCLPTLE